MMKINHKNIRYKLIKTIANNLFISYKLNSYPIDLFLLFKKFKNCRVVSYSTHMKKFNLTEKETISHFGSDEGCTIYNPLKDKYIIFYNDLDTYFKVPERVRWTLAHELGHVLLEHNKISDKTKIFRSTLSDDEYSWMEAEANRFASLLLANPIILDKLNISSEADIKKYCNLSLEASRYRYENLLKWKKKKYTTKYDLIILKQFERFINKNTCSLCNYSFYIKHANFCPICGNDEFNKEESSMIYYGIDVDKNSKALTCPKCDNEQILEDGDYCKICGTYLINRCSNISGYDTRDGFVEACGELTDGNARYCHLCGEETTFNNNGFLDNWQKEKTYYEFTKETLSSDSQTEEYSDLPF